MRPSVTIRYLHSDFDGLADGTGLCRGWPGPHGNRSIAGSLCRAARASQRSDRPSVRRRGPPRRAGAACSRLAPMSVWTARVHQHRRHRWLEQLARRSTLFIISHDRRFLSNLCTFHRLARPQRSDGSTTASSVRERRATSARRKNTTSTSSTTKSSRSTGYATAFPAPASATSSGSAISMRCAAAARLSPRHGECQSRRRRSNNPAEARRSRTRTSANHYGDHKIVDGFSIRVPAQQPHRHSQVQRHQQDHADQHADPSPVRRIAAPSGSGTNIEVATLGGRREPRLQGDARRPEQRPQRPCDHRRQSLVVAVKDFFAQSDPHPLEVLVERGRLMLTHAQAEALREPPGAEQADQDDLDLETLDVLEEDVARLQRAPGDPDGRDRSSSVGVVTSIIAGRRRQLIDAAAVRHAGAAPHDLRRRGDRLPSRRRQNEDSAPSGASKRRLPQRSPATTARPAPLSIWIASSAISRAFRRPVMRPASPTGRISRPTRARCWRRCRSPPAPGASPARSSAKPK